VLGGLEVDRDDAPLGEAEVVEVAERAGPRRLADSVPLPLDGAVAGQVCDTVDRGQHRGQTSGGQHREAAAPFVVRPARAAVDGVGLEVVGHLCGCVGGVALQDERGQTAEMRRRCAGTAETSPGIGAACDQPAGDSDDVGLDPPVGGGSAAAVVREWSGVPRIGGAHGQHP